MNHYDITIIGGGSAGYAAARTAVSLGAKTAVVDGSKTLGGLCILKGCMPTKALLESSRRWYDIRHASEFGLQVKPIRPDLSQIMRRKKGLIDDFASYRQNQLTSGKFKLFRGFASFLNPHQIKIQSSSKTTTLTSKTFILATGSTIDVLPLPGLVETGFLTSDSALELQKLPKSITILGGGAIALEFAQFFSDLGVKTTLVQRSSQILKTFDSDIATATQKALEKQGIEILTDTKLLEVRKERGLKKVFFEQSGKRKSISSEEILYALGRTPHLQSLQLEKAAISVRNGKIKVRSTMQTQNPSVFAAGDVTGLLDVVHVAIQQGEIAAINAASLLKKKPLKKRWSDRLKTTVVFTHPEVAQVGLNEAELSALKIPYKTAQYPFADHGKSMIQGELDGFMKLISDPKTGKILGGSIVGPHASELIHELIAVLYFKGTAKDLAVMPHYHPTLAEMITYPAEDLMET